MVKYSRYIQYTLIVLIILLGWQIVDRVITPKEVLTSLEIALQSAGSNRTELEKVLHHYKKTPADSLKYKAACFLIENMPYYVYQTSKQLENYKIYYAWLKKSPKSPEEIADSVKKTFGSIGVLEKKRDILEVDSAYLCNNIEWAFKVWQEQPWGKNVSFETFCEYLLPYRIDNESLTDWRETFYKKYNPLLDSLRMSDELDKEDPMVAANYVFHRLSDKYERYTETVPYPFAHIGPQYAEYMTGTCRERTDFAIYLFRALGIPCTMDFLPVRGSINAGHFWLASWDKNGEDYKTEFPGYLIPTRREWWYKWEDAAKVYRHTFSANKELYKSMASLTTDLYPLWSLPKFIDVTYSYARFYKERLQIPSSRIDKKKAKGKIAYLCMSNRDNWVPVDWTEYNANDLTFKNVRKGAVMRVATYEKGSLTFITAPFYMDKYTNEFHFYSCEKEPQDVVLYAKYSLNAELWLRKRMENGVFEGSDHQDFSIRDTLFFIKQPPYRLNTVVKSRSKKKYRYVRYIGGLDSFCNVAEVAFYAPNDSTSLKGKVIGTPGCFQKDGSHEYTNVFDGKSQTSFDYIQGYGGWAGLDLGIPREIDRIVYTPRNWDNYVCRGDKYELLYCCDGGWKSTGVIEATANSIAFHNIPQDAILLLRNRTKGVQERIFVYENGKQIWK